MGKGFFFSCYWFKPTNFLVDGMFYKLVYFAREGQENVSLRFMIETQWSLGSGETVRFTVRFKECRFPGGSGSVGFNLPDLSISSGRAAKGGCTCRCGWGGVLWLEGHWLLPEGCVTAGSRTAISSEASMPTEVEGEKKAVHLDDSSARLNGCEWNNLPAAFSICSSMLR